ncbi:MAG: MBL fold metallo-hydrolase [Lentisphaerae bacterium]|nr:MBL fold metallo-hydrolase [Lentisphaerota bacterium]
MNKSVKIITLGTSHGDPTYERFNTSSLLDIPGYGGILVDAGTPVLGLLIRKNYPLEKVRAVFITHMHQDHFGGLPDILKFWVKRLPPERKLKIFLPEAEAMETIFAFTELAHRPIARSSFEVSQIAAGKLALGENLMVEAIPTDHFSNEKLSYPSWALKFSTADKTMLFAGDLARDFHDFPTGHPADVAICELTHFALDKALDVLQKERFGKLIFTHIGNEWHGLEAAKTFSELVKDLPYSAVMAHDGDEFTV